MHAPEQQSAALAHAPPAPAQTVPPHAPALHPSPQQAPACPQACPSEAQPAGFAHRRAPVPAGSGAQTNEQQSAPT